MSVVFRWCFQPLSHLTVRYGFRASHEAFDLSALDGLALGIWQLMARWLATSGCGWQGAHPERLVSSAPGAGFAGQIGSVSLPTLGSHHGAGDLCRGALWTFLEGARSPGVVSCILGAVRVILLMPEILHHFM